jgi:hypothetical protein
MPFPCVPGAPGGLFRAWGVPGGRLRTSSPSGDRLALALRFGGQASWLARSGRLTHPVWTSRMMTQFDPGTTLARPWNDLGAIQTWAVPDGIFGHRQTGGKMEGSSQGSLPRIRSRHPLWWTWKGMIARCHSRRHPGWRTFGARGIEVCRRWREDFWAFVADVGERPAGAVLRIRDRSMEIGRAHV